MVARKFIVGHENSTFDIDYDTEDGLEVFKFQLFSLTSIPPDEQKIVCSDDSKIVSNDSDLISISDKLRLISINEDTVAESSTVDSRVNEELLKSDEELLKSDEEFARLLQAEEEALLFQEYAVADDNGQLENRLRGHIDQVLAYEDPARQEAARKTVPIEELQEKALVAIAKKEGNFEPTKVEQDHAFLLELLIWFKQSFSWVNSPPCDSCGNQTISQGMGAALPEELQYGASRVELYGCSFCLKITRFPRYNDPIKLLETRKGRCGEWANCFTLYCRAFGYESRLIMDFTDHVWTECFSHHLGRWIHLDPCDGVYDNPLLYEKGWDKKLNYVIAIANDGVYDVTKRYTRKWYEVLTRRNITTEQSLCSILEKLTKECRKGYKAEEITSLEERYRLEKEAFEKDVHTKTDAAVSLPGRLSGDKQWRISRSEYASGKTSWSSSACPVRLCVDEHVSNIYNALSLVLSQFVDSSLSVSSGVDALKSLRRLLTDFQKCPMSRRTIKSSYGSQPSLHHLLPVFGELLSTLHLKFEFDTNNEVLVHLVGHPVKASLALSVAIDALDDMIRDLAKCSNIGNVILSLPLQRLNRIHSGSVLASGEEFPFGIATSAFDGLRSSKWEEPNGAKGGWIAYRLKEGQTCKLTAYELMSANDAPERDPMDWIVEGSNDEGSSWYVLDKQTSQKFDSRFQRRAYWIESSNSQSNAFRFTFLSVRDVGSNSRLQIGSIDLYAVNS